ncbi:MAG: hypothetical protein KME12_18020 [Trichocoleus desertorum ATA4-8-CV12]|jgi:endonuclease YncB( thermonuclease family)|nr:hypothetical protein [Trichocoleus desertorum ATA4-8-CV12]
MKAGPARILVYSSLLGLLLPIAMRWGILKLFQSAQPPKLLSQKVAQTRVISMDSNTWQIFSPQHPSRSIQLAGLKPIDATWQNQANRAARMLIHAYQNQIDIQFLSPESPLALVRLPSGTLLQQILLAQGLAELHPNQKNLPTEIVPMLQQAQHSARQQHKNRWGLP